MTLYVLDAARGKKVERFDPASGGVNNFNAPRFLDPAQVAMAQNVDLDDPTRPARRHGYAAIRQGTTGIAAALQSKRISGLGELNASDQPTMLVAAIADNGSGAVYFTLDPDNSPWTEATLDGGSYDVQTDECAMRQVNNRLAIIPDGSVNPAMLGADGLLLDAGNTATSAPRNARDAAVIFGRLWMFQDSFAYYSDLNPADLSTTFDRSSQVINVAPLRGGRLIAARVWRDSSVILLYDRAITDFQVNAASPGLSQVRVIESDFGCGSRDSVAALGDDFIFLNSFGQIVSLQQTELASIQGARVQPISKPVSGELPGRLNLAAINKVRVHVIDDRLEVYYPRDLSFEANYRLTYDIPRRIWMGPDPLAHSMGQVILSRVRGSTPECFTYDAGTDSPTATVYRFGPEYLQDAGTDIAARIETRLMDMGDPSTRKLWQYLEVEGEGDVGAGWSVYWRTNDSGPWSGPLTPTKGSVTVEKASGSDFPLVPSDFPLVPGDFPLTSVDPDPARALYHLDSAVVTPSRYLQLAFEDDTGPLESKLRGFRLVADVTPHEREFVE